ncbi:MAG: putative Zn-dependent protease [Lentimonas sp.]|jgi:predicted Zn-dependent protease
MKKIVFLLIFFLSFISSKVQAISLIRDSEIENFLYDLTKPIFKAAGLKPQDIKIYIVQDSSLNAFVAGGQNIFINTGLITKYSDPNVLIGVIAHETGHITGGHLARSGEDLEKAGNAAILSYVLGIAAAATVSPDAGMALMMGGNHIANRTALRFTRTQEEAADALAIKYLKKSNNSADGLLKILKEFNSQESEFRNQIDEYAITHPISQKRINFITSNSRGVLSHNNHDLTKRLKRIIAKIDGFVNDPENVIKNYSKNDNNSKYARCIAYYRMGQTKKALKILDGLIGQTHKDSYLFDLKGQILFESGNYKEAAAAYKKTIQIDSSNNLARIALAQSIVNLSFNDQQINNLAIRNLIIALKKEKDSPKIYKILAKAHHLNGDLGQSYLALAQMSFLEEDHDNVKKYSKLARKNLSKDDKVSLLILDDLENFSEDKKLEKEEVS